jgi:hypothetical protein
VRRRRFDFADVWLDLAGERRRCVLFTLRMSYSGKAVHRVYATASQEAFLEGHVEAFEALGGCPAVHIRYDNLKPAVKASCFGQPRTETSRWASFRSWYAFEPFYCVPGEEDAHEKGGVEHEGGQFRRKHLVPPPSVESLTELNERLAAIDLAEDARHVHGRPCHVAWSRFAAWCARRESTPASTGSCRSGRLAQHGRGPLRGTVGSARAARSFAACCRARRWVSAPRPRVTCPRSWSWSARASRNTFSGSRCQARAWSCRSIAARTAGASCCSGTAARCAATARRYPAVGSG